MATYDILLVDAFTRERYAGNPCGVVTRAEGLTDTQMQAIAREINASETAFVFPSTTADFRVRFFTPGTEIPLAGHPTIATMHALAEEGRIAVPAKGCRVTQELTEAVLPVDLRREEDGSVRIVMTQAAPQFLAELDREQCARALNVEAGALLDTPTPQVVSTGTPQAMIPVRSLDVLRAVRPDPERLTALEAAAGAFGTHVFTLDTLDTANRVHARHFAVAAGIPEDPVTGSASGGMAAYLWRYGLVREHEYTAEQGHLAGRPGLVAVEVDADGDDPVAVRVSGTAVTVLRGSIEA